MKAPALFRLTRAGEKGGPHGGMIARCVALIVVCFEKQERLPRGWSLSGDQDQYPMSTPDSSFTLSPAI